MSTYGRQVLESTGRPLQVIADGGIVEWKTGGITIDWATLTAVSGAAVTIPIEGRVVAIGDKYIRYGTIMARITATGKFGPHDTAASDGRQTLTAGDCYILNETIQESEPASDHAPVFDGGRVWEARLNVGGAGQATLAQAKAAFPRLSYAKD